MGKKGTKRKTKWRALPLGEEAGGSGNEEDLLDEDQSTTSSVVCGQTANNSNIKRQPFYYKLAERPVRQTRRFTYDRFKSKEPLVKLESKTFDEEEYTKITTPRQDVLFKKGYFGRKRESSLEESAPPAGEMDGEEPMMDQIIITNGFVDERGHYLVNGNSYEIYDPYSNTVTVVVGPPPYANGVTQPVLAAVSCQPVPLQPVDWYPPAADWPSQGSAWTPSFPRNPHSDSADPPPAFPANANATDNTIPSLYNQPAYVVPGFGYGESLLYNGVPLHTSPPNEAQNPEENMPEVQKTRRKSRELPDEEGNCESSAVESAEEALPKEASETPAIVADISKTSVSPPPARGQTASPSTEEREQGKQSEGKQIEKQSHSTQTNLMEATPRGRAAPPGKESHSTQTPPEGTFRNAAATEPKLSDILFSSLAKPEGERNPAWKFQGNRYGSSVSKKFREESPRKVSHQRTHFAEDRRPEGEKADVSPVKVSYAKKAMSGLENGNPKAVNGTSDKTVNGGYKSVTPLANGLTQVIATNGPNKGKQSVGYEDKRNGFVKARYNRRTTKQSNERTRESKPEVKTLERKGEEEQTMESRSQSEKSSTISELSSPTELSSGQNTPPEKLIVQKMEEQINKSFEEKLKQNLSKTEAEEEHEEEEEEEDGEEKKKEKEEEKPRGKKKKNKGKTETEKVKTEGGRGNKKKKKRGEEGAKERGGLGSDNSSEEIPFLSNIRQKDILFGGWEGLKEGERDFISEMDSLLNGDKEILKSLGLNEDRASYSKLPLHSDLLMMLPTFGWSRPKLKIEDFFAPAAYQSDLFTKRNITSMKSTKPEEFFASVVDNAIADKTEKKKEPPKKVTKSEETPKSKTPKTTSKVNKTETTEKTIKRKEEEEEEVEEEKKKKTGGREGGEGKLGIVEAVNTWLQEQGDAEKLVSVEELESPTKKEEETDPKNGEGNPIHALCRSEEGAGDFREGSGCIRVANVITDGFIHVDKEFPGKKKSRRMYRSSSWDAKLSDMNIKKHFKFLTDSASFCQDLISDVRNGLPAGNEYATEELCDPKQAVTKYYILTPNGRLRNESDSENEVFDALEYKFLTKETQEADAKTPDRNGNASITDSGVHSDMESSEDNAGEQPKEAPCKLQ